jgi:hypothetical protein
MLSPQSAAEIVLDMPYEFIVFAVAPFGRHSPYDPSAQLFAQAIA